LHDVADVERRDPLRLVQETQDVSHVNHLGDQAARSTLLVSIELVFALPVFGRAFVIRDVVIPCEEQVRRRLLVQHLLVELDCTLLQL